MKKKILISCIIIIITSAFIIINSMKKDYIKDNENNKAISISSEKVPIKIEDINYKIEKIKNDKGEILLYLKAENNSSMTINQLSVNISDDDKLDTTIEYLQRIKPHEKTDNYDDISNSKDDRTRIPIKNKDGDYINNIGKFKVNSISYTFDDNGVEKIVNYNSYTNKYTMSNY